MPVSDLTALRREIARLEELAALAGLDPGCVDFELCSPDALCQLVAYGLPGRFAHWSHGRSYERIRHRCDLGLVSHLEVVVDREPVRAFLRAGDSLLTHQLVVAHVLAHADFFRNNAHCRTGGADAAASASLHAERLRRYAERYGADRVERWLEDVLAIEDQVDPWAAADGGTGGPPPLTPADVRWPSPARPTGDLLLFLQFRAPSMEDWERDVLAMVRAESLYFLAQARTKLVNEGWAALWQARLLRALGLGAAQVVEFARLNAAIRVPHPPSLNPYRVGASIYESLLDRLGEQSGLSVCRQIRAAEDDLAFLANHLTADVAGRLGLFGYEDSDGVRRCITRSFPEVRDALLLQVLHQGRPIVVAVDADHRGLGELYLWHRHDGRPLDVEYAQRVLESLRRLWRRPVHIETVRDGARRVLTSG